MWIIAGGQTVQIVFFQRCPQPYLLFHRETLMLLSRSGSEGLILLPSCHLPITHTIWGWARKGIEVSTLFDGTLMFESWPTVDDVLRTRCVRKPSPTARARVGVQLAVLDVETSQPRSQTYDHAASHHHLATPSLWIFPAEASDVVEQTNCSHYVLSHFGPGESWVSSDDCCFTVLRHYLWWFVTQ